MDVRSGKQVGRHRTFWCVFWANAAGGGRRYGLVKRSAHRCDGLQRSWRGLCSCEAAVWSAVVPQRFARDRALFAAAVEQTTSDSSLGPARSSRLSQLKQVLAASKTLASSRTREGQLWASLRISRSLPMDRCDACLSARLLSSPRAACDLCMYAGSRLTSPFYGIGERWMGSSA